MIKRIFTKRKTAAGLRRVVSFMTAVLFVFLSFSSFLVIGSAAAEEVNLLYKDGYDIKVQIKVTNDADGWDSAKLQVYTRDLNGRSKEEKRADEVNITDKVSEDGAEYNYTKSLGQAFPSKIRIYTDFGGGFTWRKWEADVKIYVNDVIIKAEHIFASSSAFSSSDQWTTIMIDNSKYPFPETMNIINHRLSIPELPDEENFFEFVSAKDSDTAEGNVFINACDQYGTKWDTADMTINAKTEGDMCEQISHKGYEDASEGIVCRLYCSNGNDHIGRYSVCCDTANSLHPTVTNMFDIAFCFIHKLSVIVNGEVYAEMYGSRGKVADLSLLPPVGYNLAKFTITEGSGKIVDQEFVFGKSNAVVTATLRANSYSVLFDGNGADSGSMKEQLFTYDEPQKLTSNAFQKSDNIFNGWNTKQDGSGTAYSNREKLLNVTEKQNDVITLFAQWIYTGPTVTLVYPEEMNRPNEIIQTGTGGSVKIEEAIPVDGESHYRFVSSDKPLDNITEDQTITLVYVKESHDLAKKVVAVAPTCTETGTLHSICECGHKEESVIEALGHLYGDPEWDWSDDHKSADLHFHCQRCEEVQTVSASVEVIDHEDEQIFEYSAKAEFNGKTWTDVQYDHYNIVSFDVNGGYGSIPTQKVPDGDYSIPEILASQYRRNCSFAGWMIGDEIYQPGETVDAGNMTLVAQWSMTWEDIQRVIDRGSNSIVLPCDIIADSDDTEIVIPKGKTVTIDLNGHIIDRNAAKPSDKGGVFAVDGGTLTIEDRVGGGMITGGNAINGGAVYVTNGGRFAIYSGKIALNNASKNGGAIYAYNGKVYLWGGEITGNYCGELGACVYIDNEESLLSVSGSPKIHSNGSTGTCGGVYVNKGTFDISGSPFIADNSLSDGTTSNICLAKGQKIIISDNLKVGAVVGITSNENTVITDGLNNQGSAAHFRSDKDNLIPSLNKNGEIVLVKRPAVSNPSVEGSSFSAGRIALICGIVVLVIVLIVVCIILVRNKKTESQSED